MPSAIELIVDGYHTPRSVPAGRLDKYDLTGVNRGLLATVSHVKQRALGEYQEKCFSVGYTADREFDLERDPLAVPCDDESSVNRYKVAHSFTSKWFAH